MTPVLAPLVCPPLRPGEAEGVDLILEGFLLHHATPGWPAGAGPSRAVLQGDHCYAHGLVRVAGSGDLFVVSALADLIALGAGLVAGGARGALPALWRGTTAAIAARGGPAETETAADFLHAQAALRASGDASGLERLAAALPPTPGLTEALAA